MEIVERYLPIECYGSRGAGYAPRPLAPDGIVQHYFSARYVRPETAYDAELCWRLFRDLNVEPAERRYGLYDGPRVAASAHFMIDRYGGITQLVPLAFQAWHAGVSAFEGRPDCNDYMIGIENIGQHGAPFTDAQYQANAGLCRDLMRRYGFDASRITGHEHVALPAGRKRDPGPSFNWARLRAMIGESG